MLNINLKANKVIVGAWTHLTLRNSCYIYETSDVRQPNSTSSVRMYSWRKKCFYLLLVFKKTSSFLMRKSCIQSLKSPKRTLAYDKKQMLLFTSYFYKRVLCGLQLFFEFITPDKVKRPYWHKSSYRKEKWLERIADFIFLPESTSNISRF